MFSFWLIAALLILLSLAVILFTLLRAHNEDNKAVSGNADLYQQRLNELESDINNGLLNGNEAKKVRKEYQLTLLNQEEHKSTPENSPAKESSSSTITAVILLLLIPAFVIVLYAYLGQPELITQASLLSEFNNADSHEEKQASIDKMLNQLEQRLINEPDDVDGWMMLTNSYSTLKRYPEALRAVNNLYRLRSNDPTVLIRYADIMSLANGGIFAGKPTELINEALRLDPDNASGLWFAGLAANERNDIQLAITYWQRLLPKLDEGSKPQQEIKQFLELAIKQVESEQAINASTATQEHKLNLTVSLSEELINEASQDDTVFIYAQAINGPPMPIAIIRKKVSDLPLQTTLDDSTAMMPTNKLSNHAQVRLIARISKSGNAKPESGDLIGILDTVNTDTLETFEIHINQKTP